MITETRKPIILLFVMLLVVLCIGAALTVNTHAATSIYEVMSNAVKNYQETINVSGSGLTTDNISEIFLKFTSYYPEYFYVNSNFSYNYNKNTNELNTLTFKYLYSRSETENIKIEYEKAVSEALSCVSDKMSDLEKALAIHDYLVLHMIYNYDDYKNNTLTAMDRKSYKALVDGSGVCAGYAFAYSDLMKRLGIECLYVTGEAGGEAHAWNMVRINGVWYHVDATWDDPTCLSSSGWKNNDNNLDGRVSHDYFLVSDEYMLANRHTSWCSYAPAATSKTYEKKYAGIESGMFYYNGLWYYTEKKQIYRSGITLENKTLATDAEGCSYLYLYDNQLFYIRNVQSHGYSEIRSIILDGTDDMPVIHYENKDKAVSAEITEFVVFRGRLRYTVHTTSTDGTSDNYTVKYFDVASLIPGLSDNCWYNNDITVRYIKERNVTVDGRTVNEDIVMTEGDHIIVVYDTHGDYITISIRIDKNAPVVTGVENGMEYKPGKKITFNEGYAYLDGKDFASGSTVNIAGEHKLVVYDKAGNSTEITFNIKNSLLNLSGIIPDVGEVDFFDIVFPIAMIGIVLVPVNAVIYLIIYLAAMSGMSAYCKKNIRDQIFKLNAQLDEESANLNIYIALLKERLMSIR